MPSVGTGRNHAMRRVLTALVALGVVAALVSPVSGWRSSRASAAPTAADHLFVSLKDGFITGTLTPNAAFSASLVKGTVTKATANGVAGPDGKYTVQLRYDAGHGPNIHNGDLVRLTSGGITYEQPAQLSGFLDEETGVLSGVTRPGAVLSIDLFTNGDMATRVATTPAVADADGRYLVDFSTLVTPKPTTDRPEWRGYVANVESRDTPGQALFRQFQTANTTLLSTRNLAGGGYMTPGDTVTFQLSRDGGVRATTTALVDGDGIPQATFPTDVGDGDVLTTTYHTPTGETRSQVLDPWNFTMRVDMATNSLQGTTAPNAPVVGEYFSPQRVVVVHGRADDAGDYRLDLDSVGVQMVGNIFLVAFRIAEPGFTGVGAQQVEGRTPYVGLDDVRSLVSGTAGQGVNPVRVDLVRGGATVASATGTTTKSGAFANLAIGQEVLPDDQLVVSSNGVTYSAFSPGPELRAHREADAAAASGWRYAGTGAPGSKIDAMLGLSGGRTCAVSAAVDSSGQWAVPLPCAITGNEWAQLQATQQGGPTAGSYLLHFENVTQPVTSIVSPAPAAVVGGRTVSIVVRTADIDDGAAASKVMLQIDDQWIQATQGTYSWDFTAKVRLAPGAHTVTAYAYDAGSRVDLNGKAIFAQTPRRVFTVK